jgi:hypothetical protein
MILQLLNVLLTTFALIGWGNFLARRAFGLDASDAVSQIFLNGLLAVIPLSLMALIISFFWPLTYVVSEMVLSLGAVISLSYLFLYWNQVQKHKLAIAVSFLGLFFLVCISVDNNLMGDSLLYHIQTLMWFKSDKVVVGLANIHDRFGFNSLWHLFLALITAEISPTHYVDAGGVAVAFLFGGFISARGFEKKQENDNDWLIYGFLFFIFFVIWGKGSQLDALGSPSTDLPAGIYTLVLLTLWWEWQKDLKKNRALGLLGLVALSLMIKLSQIHLVLIALQVSWFLWKGKTKSTLFVTAGILGLFFLMWMFRSWLLSGCFIFPSAVTCWPSVGWRLPLPEVIDVSNWIKSWPRTPSVPPAEVLNSWGWLPGWFERSWQIKAVRISMVLMVIGFIPLIGQRRSLSTRDRRVLVYSFFAFGIWFMLAPDWRFILAVLIFMLALLLGRAMEGWQKKYLRFQKIVAAILFLVVVQDQLRIAGNVLTRNPIEKILEVSDMPATIEKTSQYGIFYRTGPPGDNFICAFTPLPCAPFAKDKLVEEKWGSYRVFKTGP